MEKRPVTILVTGFGPFGNEAINPSYLIATTLPALIPETPACPVSIRISLYPYQIPVSYEEVRALIPRLYAAYEGRIDIILHMGMASSRNYYSIEKQGHRDNYDAFADIYGHKLDKRDGLTFWPDCPPTLETSLNFNDVFQRWRNILINAPEVSPGLDGVVLRPSNDAGHFLCDFIYYSNLAEHWLKRKDSNDVDKVDARPVMFMHVPRWTGADDLQKGRFITIALLRALAHSWRVEKSAEAATRSFGS